MRTIRVYDLMRSNFDFQLNEYPIFNEEYREVLNWLILEHYKWHEICYDNPAKWRDRLKYRMYNIMSSYYNELFEKRMTEFDPFDNVNMHETFTREVNSMSDTSGKSSSSDSGESRESLSSNVDTSASANNKAYNYNFPDTILTNSEIDSKGFVSNGSKVNSDSRDTSQTHNLSENRASNTNSSESSGTAKGKDIETYERHTWGSSAGLAFSKAMIDLKKFYDEFNLNNEIIAELQDLFLTVWDVQEVNDDRKN